MTRECGEVDRTSPSHLIFNLRRSVLNEGPYTILLLSAFATPSSAHTVYDTHTH